MTAQNISIFDRAYQTLNPQQRRAVDQLDGPVMVSAGPGTGKTQVLATRIANILRKTDTPPRAILALTFTESAAKNMRERLISLIGHPAYQVQISTFHAFCKTVITNNPEYFLLDRDSEAIAELERYELFEQLIQNLELSQLRPLNAPYFYIKEIIKAISNLKRESITPVKYAELIEQEKDYLQELKQATKPKKTSIAKQVKKVAKNEDLLKIYQAYQIKLKELARYDFDDMIALVVEAFINNEELLLDYQENLLYFLIDEYQDTNSAQNKIIQLLASYWQEKANVFVVGDPNQAIYRFQGASVENMVGFLAQYPQATHIQLETGYRCPQEIYNQAHQLISYNQALESVLKTSPAGKSLLVQPDLPLKSVNFSKTQLKLYQAPSQILEALYIAQQIRALLDSGIPAEEIAVLYRNNADMMDLADVFVKLDIPYEVNGGNNVFEAEHILQLLDLFKAIIAIRQAEEIGLLYQLMQYSWLGFDSLLIMKLGRIAGKCDLSIYELIEQGYEQVMLLIEQKKLKIELTKEDWQPVAEFLQKLINWSQLDFQLPFTDWFEKILQESGFLAWILTQADKFNLLLSLNTLYGQVKKLVYQDQSYKLVNFLATVELMQTHGMVLQTEDLNIVTNRVSLATVHKAKGREWSYVFLYNLIDGKWGNKRRRELIPLPSNILTYTQTDTDDSDDDERRLFYVALTRAKKQVTLTYPQTLVKENHSREVIASQFLHELSEVVEQQAPDLESQAEQLLVDLLSPAVSLNKDQSLQQTQQKQQAFFAALVKDFRLSVTALNSYLRDPQEFVENFLLRVPRAKPAVMAFGSAVHFALEQLYKPLLKQQSPLQLTKVLQIFEQALSKEILAKDEFAKRLQYGQEILTKYYHFYLGNNQFKAEPLMIEKFFGSGFSKTMLGDIILTGRIDRIDWLDKNQQTVTVIDYKTGKIKSINEIEGLVNTQNYSERELVLPEIIRGSYKRQLLFYKLLCELDKSFRPIVNEGVFDFIEPRKTNDKLVQRRFVLEDEAVEELKKLIKQVMTEIRSLEFLKILN